MTSRRAIHSILAAAAMLIVLVTPVAAGKFACSLQATVFGGSATEVNVGEEVLIEGFGFPANADVFVVYSFPGTTLPPVTVTADGAGTFETTITPAAGQEGLWDVEASDDGQLCTALTSFLVLGVTPTATPSPAPTATPTATPATGELPNVATAPPPAMPVWILGLAVLLLSAVTVRQALKARRG